MQIHGRDDTDSTEKRTLMLGTNPKNRIRDRLWNVGGRAAFDEPELKIHSFKRQNALLQIVHQQTLGVPPASTVCIHVRSMFCPVRMTAARRPCSGPRSLVSAANAAAPAPSVQLWVAL